MAEELFERYYPSLSAAELDDCTALVVPDKAALAYKQLDDGCHICGLVVVPEYRGQGIATRLIKYLASQCLPLTANILFTEMSNMPFWRRLGFTPSEVNPAAGYIQLRRTA